MQCEQFEQILEQQDEGSIAEAGAGSPGRLRGLPRALGGFRRDPRSGFGAGNGRDCSARARVGFAAQSTRGGGADSYRQEVPVGASVPQQAWWSVFQRPAVAGAFLGLVLAAASTIGYLSNFTQSAAHSSPLTPQQETSSVPSADSVFKEEVLTVGSDSIPGLQRQDTAVTDSIRRNLQIVDNFIAICEKSVREQPDNQMAREYLYGAYQQKAELLATATNRNLTGGLQ